MGSIFFNRKRDLGIPDIERIVLHDAEILSFDELDGGIVRIKVDDGTGQLQLLNFTGVSRINSLLQFSDKGISVKQAATGSGLAGAECERIDLGFRTYFLNFSGRPILLIEHTGFEVELLGEIAG